MFIRGSPSLLSPLPLSLKKADVLSDKSIDEEREAQSGEATSPRLHSKHAGKFQRRQALFTARPVLHPHPPLQHQAGVGGGVRETEGQGEACPSCLGRRMLEGIPGSRWTRWS